MATNTDPIFTGAPLNPFAPIVTAANTAMDGTGTVTTLFTAGTDGGFVGMIKLKPTGTNVASVARFFGNNGSTNATATNNWFLGEVTLPATTASATAALIELALPVFQGFQNGYKINMTLGTAVAAGWQASAEAGSFTKG